MTEGFDAQLCESAHSPCRPRKPFVQFCLFLRDLKILKYKTLDAIWALQNAQLDPHKSLMECFAQSPLSLKLNSI